MITGGTLSTYLVFAIAWVEFTFLFTQDLFADVAEHDSSLTCIVLVLLPVCSVCVLCMRMLVLGASTIALTCLHGILQLPRLSISFVCKRE